MTAMKTTNEDIDEGRAGGIGFEAEAGEVSARQRRAAMERPGGEGRVM